ncbi:MAG: 2'-deoxycytidine 5'-triphosphate deaminase [SAR202 cluster bacterium]|nr:2'-deoxycytidine 5'-triphosphate deaminase [SAR202 cluster bacterium]
MPDAPSPSAGILPVQQLRRAASQGIIRPAKAPIPDSSFQPASMDLRLGDKAYRLRCSFLPDTRSVMEKLVDHSMGEIDLQGGAILERNRPYLIPLVEELRLPQGLRAKANPRSSTGRLDIFTRVITDYSYKFDEIAPGYQGKLYLEVVPRSFTIRVKSGLSLNQLRLIQGQPRCTDQEILEFHQRTPVIYRSGQPVSPALADGLFLSIDLTSDQDRRPVGYRAKKNSQLIDLSLLGHYQAQDFWEPVHAERGDRLVLEPEEFYLLLSDESVSIPPEFAAEMVAYEPTSGELRTHYAGFFDPGFGYDPQGRLPGTRAVMEVRAHDVPFMVEHGQKVCKLWFEKMLARPDILYGPSIGSAYQRQELTLSKHFVVSGKA